MHPPQQLGHFLILDETDEWNKNLLTNTISLFIKPKRRKKLMEKKREKENRKRLFLKACRNGQGWQDRYYTEPKSYNSLWPSCWTNMVYLSVEEMWKFYFQESLTYRTKKMHTL